MEAAGSSESLPAYEIRRLIPEDRSLKIDLCESLRSHRPDVCLCSVVYSLRQSNCLYRVRPLTSWAHRMCTPLHIKAFDEGEWKTKGVCVFYEPYFRVLN
jgi:hypothetical protein